MVRKGMVVAGCITAMAAGGVAEAQRAERRPGSTFDASLAQRVGKAFSVEVTDVRCPARVTVRRGNAFRCNLTTSAGDVAGVRVVVRDSAGRFRWRLLTMMMRDLENHMERTMVEMGDPGAVQCPWRRRVREGDTFRCFGLNRPATRAYNFDATQRGDGIVRYVVTERP